MIYTLTLNPSLDYLIDVKNFKKGSVNRTTAETIVPGGKGINVSMVLKNLGYESIALGFYAGFTGQQLLQLLAEKHIQEDFLQVESGMTRINVKLRAEEETEINGQGPVFSTSDMEKLYEKLDKLQKGDMLVLAGSIPDTMPKTVYMEIMEYLQEKSVEIVVDATKDLLVNVLKYQPFLIKPNHHELGELFEVSITDKQQAAEYAKELQSRGAKNVLVSMAGDGAVLLAEDGTIYQSDAPKGIVKNSVGAGDSMVAGFLAGYLEKQNYEYAFQMGVCTGSASAFSESLATEEEVLTLMKCRDFISNSYL